MNVKELLGQLFPDGYQITEKDSIVSGNANLNGQDIAFIGTCDHAFIGIREIIALCDKFMEIIKNKPSCPILMLVDNNGQRMALEEELLALPEYIGHIISIQDYARRNGHKVISLVYGNAIAGGFIAFGMGAQSRIYAVEGANPSVMNLPAISRVTKLPLEQLEELSKTVPVFAPGCDNFYKMGGLHGIWQGNLSACLQEALDNYSDDDNRAQIALERGGRTETLNIINEVINA
jgi:malonate decarboxylase gamma subunit